MFELFFFLLDIYVADIFLQATNADLEFFVIVLSVRKTLISFFNKITLLMCLVLILVVVLIGGIKVEFSYFSLLYESVP